MTAVTAVACPSSSPQGGCSPPHPLLRRPTGACPTRRAVGTRQAAQAGGGRRRRSNRLSPSRRASRRRGRRRRGAGRRRPPSPPLRERRLHRRRDRVHRRLGNLPRAAEHADDARLDPSPDLLLVDHRDSPSVLADSGAILTVPGHRGNVAELAIVRRAGRVDDDGAAVEAGGVAGRRPGNQRPGAAGQLVQPRPSRSLSSRYGSTPMTRTRTGFWAWVRSPQSRASPDR